jgi:hypothetical protein
MHDIVDTTQMVRWWLHCIQLAHSDISWQGPGVGKLLRRNIVTVKGRGGGAFLRQLRDPNTSSRGDICDFPVLPYGGNRWV